MITYDGLWWLMDYGGRERLSHSDPGPMAMERCYDAMLKNAMAMERCFLISHRNINQHHIAIALHRHRVFKHRIVTSAHRNRVWLRTRRSVSAITGTRLGVY